MPKNKSKKYRIEYFALVAAATAAISVPVFANSMIVMSQNDMGTTGDTPPTVNTSTVRTLGTLRMDELNNPTPTAANPMAQAAPMAPEPEQGMQPSQANGITYVTGGIGDEEREALDNMKHDFNLHVVSAGMTGEFSGDTHIVISDTHGNELVNVPAGPIFYAQLPPGTYTIEGVSNNQSKKQVIKVSAKKSSFIHFTWH